MSRSSEALAELLEERRRPGANVPDVDRRIVSLFGETWCVVFTGLAGRETKAAESGIIDFLSRTHELDKIVAPIVQKNCGFTLKKTAGSSMIIFRDPRAALRTCVEIQQQLSRNNRRSGQPELLLGCGIGHGPCIKLGDDDVFGVEVNLAAWLGEAIAGPYEVLLTPAALEAIGQGPFEGVRFEEIEGATVRWLRAAFTGVPAGAAAQPTTAMGRPKGDKRSKKSSRRLGARR